MSEAHVRQPDHLSLPWDTRSFFRAGGHFSFQEGRTTSLATSWPRSLLLADSGQLPTWLQSPLCWVGGQAVGVGVCTLALAAPSLICLLFLHAQLNYARRRWGKELAPVQIFLNPGTLTVSDFGGRWISNPVLHKEMQSSHFQPTNVCVCSVVSNFLRLHRL